MTRFTRIDCGEPHTTSAAGPWKTTISPVCRLDGEKKTFWTRIRSPTCSVGIIEPDGTKYAWKTKVRMANASASATTATIAHSIAVRDRDGGRFGGTTALWRRRPVGGRGGASLSPSGVAT